MTHIELEPSLHGWVANGLITGRQADDILEHEVTSPFAAATAHTAAVPGAAVTAEVAHADLATLPPPPPPPPAGAYMPGAYQPQPSYTPSPPRPGNVSLGAEAAGYVGAVLTAVAGVLVVQEFWGDLHVFVRFLMLAILSGGLFAAGWAVRDSEEPAAERLTAVVWTMVVATSGWAIGITVGRDGADLADNPAAVLITMVMAAIAAGLWWLNRTWLQHMVTWASGGAFVIAMAGLVAPDGADGFWWGLPIIAYGVFWLIWTDMEDGLALFGMPLALITIVVGMQVTTFGDARAAWLLLMVAASASFLGIYVKTRRKEAIAAAAGGLMLFVPQAVFELTDASFVSALALLITGLTLLGGVIYSVRGGGDGV